MRYVFRLSSELSLESLSTRVEANYELKCEVNHIKSKNNFYTQFVSDYSKNLSQNIMYIITDYVYYRVNESEANLKRS